jgi:hypothetical protein
MHPFVSRFKNVLAYSSLMKADLVVNASQVSLDVILNLSKYLRRFCANKLKVCLKNAKIWLPCRARLRPFCPRRLAAPPPMLPGRIPAPTAPLRVRSWPAPRPFPLRGRPEPRRSRCA